MRDLRLAGIEDMERVACPTHVFGGNQVIRAIATAAGRSQMTEVGKAEGVEEMVRTMKIHHHGTVCLHADAEGIVEHSGIERQRCACKFCRLRETVVNSHPLAKRTGTGGEPQKDKRGGQTARQSGQKRR